MASGALVAAAGGTPAYLPGHLLQSFHHPGMRRLSYALREIRAWQYA